MGMFELEAIVLMNFHDSNMSKIVHMMVGMSSLVSYSVQQSSDIGLDTDAALVVPCVNYLLHIFLSW